MRTPSPDTAGGVLVPALVCLVSLLCAPGPAGAQDGGPGSTGGARPAGGEGSIPGWDGHPGPAGGEVYLTAPQAVREIFGSGVTVVADRWRLTPEQARRIRERARTGVPDSTLHVLRVEDGDGSFLGWAMTVDERGKYRPITFMVGIGPEFAVKGVEILVYREDRGEEVRHDRFLRQYRGKQTGDAVRTYRDIMNITGATISVRSVNAGVRRVLATVEVLYRGAVPEGENVVRGVAERRVAGAR